MPIPKPRKGEKQSDFMGRCMSDEVMVSEYKDSKQRAAICNSSWGDRTVSNTLDAEVFAVGKWNGLEFTQDDLRGIVAAFHKLKEKLQVPIKMGHNDEQPFTDGQPALGWVEDLWISGDKLMARFVEMPDVVFSAIQNKLYRNVSIELEMGVEYKGDYYPWVMSGVALLGADIPAVNTLKDLTAYMHREVEGMSFSKRVAFTAIHGKSKQEEIDDMTELEKAKAEIERLKKEVEVREEQALRFTREQLELKAKVAEFEAKQKLAEEEAKKAKFAKAKSDLITKLDSMVKSKHITPAQREKFITEFEEDDAVIDRLNFTLDVLAVGSKNAGLDEGEQGSSGGDNEEEGGSPDDVLSAKIYEYMSKNSVAFSAARDVVMKANPDLAKQYRDMNGEVKHV